MFQIGSICFQYQFWNWENIQSDEKHFKFYCLLRNLDYYCSLDLDSQRDFIMLTILFQLQFAGVLLYIDYAQRL